MERVRERSAQPNLTKTLMPQAKRTSAIKTYLLWSETFSKTLSTAEIGES